ncbi:unnamed protein product [Lathyrus sativus]|nr:unnamed protein product [Lathyrus sativus]
MKDFSEFIEALNVMDLPVFGNRFTWLNSNGKCRSRLDIILVDDRAISLLSLKNQVVGDRDVSDHRPVWLKSNFFNWGPKPFRTFNYWFSHKEFIPFVMKLWNSYLFTGTSCNILIKKLQALKTDLRNWNYIVFGWLELKIKDNIENFNKLELDSVVDLDSQAAELDRERLRYQEEMNRLNRLSAVRMGGRIEEEPEGIKSEALKFFKERYLQLDSSKFRCEFDLVACLEEERKLFLEADFSSAEVRKDVFSCDGNKCPGVDGFNIKFIKSCWDIVGQDFTSCILEFFKTGFILKMFVSSFISLVPKINNPQHFEDFRPITHVSCVLNVISKI